MGTANTALTIQEELIRNITADQMEIAEAVKEKYGYVCKDIVQEYKKFDKKEKAEDGKYYLNNKFKKYVHKPSNGGKPVEIDVGYERLLAPEMFFYPGWLEYWNDPYWKYIHAIKTLDQLDTGIVQDNQ